LDELSDNGTKKVQGSGHVFLVLVKVKVGELLLLTRQYELQLLDDARTGGGISY
jgi:hypothetical protein